MEVSVCCHSPSIACSRKNCSSLSSLGTSKASLNAGQAGSVVLRDAGVHFHEFIDGTLPPCQLFCGDAHLPLRRQGAIPIVLQAHQPLVWRDTVDLSVRAHHARASAVPRRENRGYPGGCQGSHTIMTHEAGQPAAGASQCIRK